MEDFILDVMRKQRDFLNNYKRFNSLEEMKEKYADKKKQIRIIKDKF